MLTNQNNRPIKIAITMGEPAGIGCEIIMKSLMDNRFQNVHFTLIGDKNLFPCVFPDNVTFHQIDFNNSVTMGVCRRDYAEKIITMIDIGVDYCLDKSVDALVTAPINKETLHAINPHFFGHTDYIAERIFKKTNRFYMPVMMLSCPDLRTVPLTIHIPLKDVANTLTTQMIIEKIVIVHDALQTQFGIQNPRIKIAGLNPHAGDKGVMGHEETDIIMPAIEDLRHKGINISDPTSADIMFHAEARKTYDVAVCMYHDQALIPVKTLGFDVGVNVTLGLPIIRTSPDHGTALDIAGQNKASEQSMIAAIHEAMMLVKHARLSEN